MTQHQINPQPHASYLKIITTAGDRSISLYDKLRLQTLTGTFLLDFTTETPWTTQT